MLHELLQKREEFEKQILCLQEEVDAINIDIENLLSGRLVDLRKLQGKEYGVVTMTFDGIKVSENIPKKVEWEQNALKKLWEKIKSSGDDPQKYIKIKFDVPEKLYNEFSSEIKEVFDEARSVKQGKPQIKLEKNK